MSCQKPWLQCLLQGSQFISLLCAVSLGTISNHVLRLNTVQKLLGLFPDGVSAECPLSGSRTCSALVGTYLYWGLPGMELMFPTAAPTALCSALGARTALPLHQCLGYCGAVLAEHQDSLQAPQSQEVEGGQEVGRGHHQGS